MGRGPAHVGDTHNFGRRVRIGDAWVEKPRTLLWEWLLLSAESPLRRLLEERALEERLGSETFAFLPDLAFDGWQRPHGGVVERIELAPLGPLSAAERRALARVFGHSLALFAWLGVADLHWENLALGRASEGRIVLAPLDVELILADLSLPTETKLLPASDPEYAYLCRHAAGARRILPYLGKPVEPSELVAMALAYLDMLAFLDRHARAVADVLGALPELREAPIRVCLRGTGDYVEARSTRIWPPLLDEESEQLERGDIPYFFRLYGRPGIHCYADPSLETLRTLPTEGDVPQLDPLLSLARGLRSPSRTTLREQGLFAVLAAFDHPSFRGTHAVDGLEVAFGKRTLRVRFSDGEELDASRDLSAFVGSVYLPCECGEVRSVQVPTITRCIEVRERPPRDSSRSRARRL